jgi:anti-sigma factor RsiW
MTKREPSRGGEASRAQTHRHEKKRCLAILRELSAFIDDELSSEICREIRLHLGVCPNCELFVASLRQTVSLCRHKPVSPLSAADRSRLREEILRAAQAR